MKLQKLKHIVLLILVVFSTSAIAQTKEDSLVCIPKSTMIKVVQDLKSYDACKKEVIILDSMYKTEHTAGLVKDTIIQDLKANEHDYKMINQNYDIITRKQTDQIRSLSATVVLWKGISIATTAILGTLLIIK